MFALFVLKLTNQVSTSALTHVHYVNEKLLYHGLYLRTTFNQFEICSEIVYM